MGQHTERLGYSPREAADAIGVSHMFIYKLMNNGDLPYVKVGRRTIIAHDSLVALTHIGANFEASRAAQKVEAAGGK